MIEWSFGIVNVRIEGSVPTSGLAALVSHSGMDVLGMKSAVM